MYKIQFWVFFVTSYQVTACPRTPLKYFFMYKIQFWVYSVTSSQPGHNIIHLKPPHEGFEWLSPVKPKTDGHHNRAIKKVHIITLQ